MLELPKISKISADYANLLATSGGAVHINIHAQDYQLAFYEGAFEYYEGEVLAQFKVDSEHYSLLLKSFFFEDHLKSYFKDLNIMNVNQEVKLILMDLALNEIMASLRATIGVEQVELVNLEFKPKKAKIEALMGAAPYQFPFMIQDQNQMGEAREALLLSDATGASYWIKKMSQYGEKIDQELDFSKLYSSVLLSLGSAKFTVFDLCQVMLGDVILIHNFKWAETGYYAHLWSEQQLLFLLNIKDQEIIVEQKMDLSMTDEDDEIFNFSEGEGEDENFKKLQALIAKQHGEDEDHEDHEALSDNEAEEPSMEGAEAHIAEVEAPAPHQPRARKVKGEAKAESEMILSEDLKHLPIKLNFVVGSQVMSLEELQKLGPGYHFNLNKAPTASISILANGREFAEGELVQIENHVGVKLTKILIEK